MAGKSDANKHAGAAKPSTSSATNAERTGTVPQGVQGETNTTRPILESRNVFIDTSEFERLAYAFKSGLLKLLRDHERINIVLSEVVILEIRDHLKKAGAESVRLHKSFSDSAKVLRNLGGEGFASLFERFDSEATSAAFAQAFDEFLGDAAVTTIPYANANLDDIFERYFSVRPPFESGKKKSEFPDAFALDSVRRWACDNKTTVYVVSRDVGMQRYCEEVPELNYVDSVEQFLDMAVRQDEEMAGRIKAIIAADREVLEERLNQEFPYMGFYIDDREGVVEDVTVTGADIHDFLIVELKDGVATVELDVTVTFNADVSYDDIEHGIWDSETGELWTQSESDEWERELRELPVRELEWIPPIQLALALRVSR
jgi:hypothetical protein